MAATVDLLVVGAGPAGVAAALTAHGARASTCSSSTRPRFPRDKTCGDGLTTGALRLLEQPRRRRPRPRARRPASTEAVLVAPSGRRSLPLPSDGHGSGSYAAVVARRDLDAALVARARARGVAVREAPPCGSRDARPAATTRADRRADARPRHRVGDDAIRGPLRRRRRRPLLDRPPPARPGAPPDLGTWHAFRQYFRGVDDPRLWVLFERDLLPGYAWVFPLPGGRANVGFGVLRDAG